VPLPDPAPGLVISYSYLWHSEYLEGREEGRKDRPCAIIAAIRTVNHSNKRVLVLPVTYRPPEHPGLAVEISAKVKQRLRLDDAPSFVVLSEWNEFVWPGPDLRQLTGADPSSAAYGMLPPGLFALVRDRFLALFNLGAARQVRRT
jgi:hypothetical protein